MIGSYENLRDIIMHVDCWYLTNNSYTLHFHSSIELTYVISGQLVGKINGEQYTLNAHDFLLCPCYSLHSYETPHASQSIVLTVPLDTIPFFQKQLNTKRFKYTTASLPADNELLHCLKQLIASPKDNFVLRKGYAYTIMGILTDILKLQPLSSMSDTHFARDILLYLQESFLLPLTIERVAEHFGYSRGHFSHIFTNTFGFTFHEYHNFLRCRHASTLLTSGSSSLIEIAMNCGYENIRTFYRNFKHFFGMTPTQFISAHRNDS